MSSNLSCDLPNYGFTISIRKLISIGSVYPPYLQYPSANNSVKLKKRTKFAGMVCDLVTA